MDIFELIFRESADEVEEHEHNPDAELLEDEDQS